MRQMRAVCTLSAVLAPLLLVTPPPATAKAKPAPPDLSGEWTLDRARSEDPREKMRDSREGRGGFGGRPGGGRSPGGRPPSGGPPSGGPTGRRQERRSGEGPERLFDTMSYEHLTVRAAERSLVVRLADGSTRTLYTDGRKLTGDDDAQRADATGKWKKGKLVVERKTERGSIRETWELSEDGTTLFVTTRLPGGGPMPSISFLRTFVRLPDDDATAGAGS